MLDWLVILAWVGVTAAIGVPLYAAGVTAPIGPLALNVVSALVVVVPVVIGLAWAEAGGRQASPGKRWRRLSVVDSATEGRVTLGRALWRNLLKIGLPWTIGHSAVIAIVATSKDGSVPWSAWILTAAAYVLPLAYVASLFIRDGRAPYDRAAGTHVVTTE